MDQEKEILRIIKQKKEEINELKNKVKHLKETDKTPFEIKKEKEQREKSFNGLSAKEWALYSRSVWNDVSSMRNKKHLKHGATFPQKLADRVLKMYSREGDIVFDPFLGTGTTLYSSKELKRKFIGIELNTEFINYINQENKGSLFSDEDDYKVYEGDCLDKVNLLKDNSIQLTFTSPPYANLLRKVEEDRLNRHKKSKIVTENNSTSKPYSNMIEDFGNMDINDYRKSVLKLMKKIYRKTKPGGYNIWVVKDFRDVRNKVPYIDLHSLISDIGKKAGFKFQDLIIWDQNEQRSLVLLGYPSVFYVNQNHSYLVVLKK